MGSSGRLESMPKSVPDVLYDAIDTCFGHVSDTGATH